MVRETPQLHFPCSIQDIKEAYESAGLIQELEGHVVISVDGRDMYFVKSPIVGDGMYIPITQDGKDISDCIKSIDTFKGQVNLEGGVVNFDANTGALQKHGEYYVLYDEIDNRDAECKMFSFNDGALQLQGVMLFNCNQEIKPFTFKGEDISKEVTGINVREKREDTVSYKGGTFLFDQITGELRSWNGYAVTYEPNNNDVKKFYQLYDVSGDTAKKAGYILIKSTAQNPESIFESATSVTLNGTSISEQISAVRNKPYDGVEVQYKGVWLQLDETSGAIKTYDGLPYGVHEEVVSTNAPQHFYKLYSFDAESPIVCGYGVGMEDNNFIPITLHGKDISREVSNMFDSSPTRNSDESMTIHGRVHVEFDGTAFSLSPTTGEVITLKGHPINLVENGVNVYTLGEDGYELEEDNRFDITLGGKRIGGVLQYERSSYKYDIHAIELDGKRVSVDNKTCELCNVVDSSGRQFLYYTWSGETIYYFVNNGKLTHIQDTGKIEELEGLRKGTPETVSAEVNNGAMSLL